jgi:hypothetical protein
MLFLITVVPSLLEAHDIIKMEERLKEIWVLKIFIVMDNLF